MANDPVSPIPDRSDIIIKDTSLSFVGTNTSYTIAVTAVRKWFIFILLERLSKTCWATYRQQISTLTISAYHIPVEELHS